MTHTENSVKNYRIAVIIPTWNRKKLIKKAILSALNQSYQPHEIIVCDDGSTDGTEQVVSGINSNLIRYFHLPHSGHPSVARNYGIQISKSNFIAFLDSDDYWHEDKLKKQVDQLQLSKCNFVCSNATRVHSESTKTALLSYSKSYIDYDDLLASNMIITSSVVLSKDLLQAVSLFPTENDMRIYQDYALWLRLVLSNKFYYSNEQLVDYNDEPDASIRGSSEQTHIQMTIAVYINFLSWLSSKRIYDFRFFKAIFQLLLVFLFRIKSNILCFFKDLIKSIMLK